MKSLCLILALLFTLSVQAETGKVIIVYKPDKTISVIHPILQTRKEGESLDTFFYRVYLDATVGTDLYKLPYDVFDTKDLPSRDDRDYWEGIKGEGVLTNTLKKSKNKKEKERNKLINERVEKNNVDKAIEELIAEGKIEED